MTLTATHFIQGHKTTRKPTKIAVLKLMPTTMMATGKHTIEEIWELEYRENLKVPLPMDQTPKWSEDRQVWYD
jgi:hypothetical protein